MNDFIRTCEALNIRFQPAKHWQLKASTAEEALFIDPKRSDIEWHVALYPRELFPQGISGLYDTLEDIEAEAADIFERYYFSAYPNHHTPPKTHDPEFKALIETPQTTIRKDGIKKVKLTHLLAAEDNLMVIAKRAIYCGINLSVHLSAILRRSHVENPMQLSTDLDQIFAKIDSQGYKLILPSNEKAVEKRFVHPIKPAEYFRLSESALLKNSYHYSLLPRARPKEVHLWRSESPLKGWAKLWRLKRVITQLTTHWKSEGASDLSLEIQRDKSQMLSAYSRYHAPDGPTHAKICVWLDSKSFVWGALAAAPTYIAREKLEKWTNIEAASR